MGTLGHKLFEPITKPLEENIESGDMPMDETNRLYLKRTIKNVGTVEATGIQTAEGFVVLVGSHISPSDDDTIPTAIKEKRQKVVLDAEGRLMENLLFNSPSYAAMFVIGKSANGLTSWRNETGQTLKSLETEN